MKDFRWCAVNLHTPSKLVTVESLHAPNFKIGEKVRVTSTTESTNDGEVFDVESTDGYTVESVSHHFDLVKDKYLIDVKLQTL